MVVGELLILIAILTGGGLGLKALSGLFKTSRDTKAAMRGDLRKSLLSHDYKDLDDFLMVWGDRLDAKVVERVKARRDELWIENDEKKP